MKPKLAFLSESALELVFPEPISEATLDQVRAAGDAFRRSEDLRRLGVTDVVPAWQRIAFYFSGSEEQADDIMEIIRQMPLPSGADEPPAHHILPVCYDGEDLERIADHAGLAVEKVIRLHSAPVYRVAMIGFRPHFPYLFGLDERLALPRRAEPRASVPAGSVAIGGCQTGVYPETSPGGWHLLGSTDPRRLLDLNTGDRVRFEVQP